MLKRCQAEGKRHEFYCPKGEKNKTFDANFERPHEQVAPISTYFLTAEFTADL